MLWRVSLPKECRSICNLMTLAIYCCFRSLCRPLTPFPAWPSEPSHTHWVLLSSLHFTLLITPVPVCFSVLASELQRNADSIQMHTTQPQISNPFIHFWLIPNITFSSMPHSSNCLMPTLFYSFHSTKANWDSVMCHSLCWAAGNTGGSRADFSLGRGKGSFPPSLLYCKHPGLEWTINPLTFPFSVLSLCLLVKSFLPSLLSQEKSQSTSFPMNSWFYSLLPSSKTLLSVILNCFYSEINDISLKSFKQPVLNKNADYFC